MSKKEKIVKIILEEVGILNEYLPESQQLELSPQTVLFGEEGSLDSLALVNLRRKVPSEQFQRWQII